MEYHALMRLRSAKSHLVSSTGYATGWEKFRGGGVEGLL